MGIAAPKLSINLLLLIFAIGALESIATFYSFRVIKHGSLSIVAPLESSTPLILIPLGFLVLNEQLTLPALFAVALLSSGVYLLLLKPKTSYIQPFVTLFSDKVAFSVLLYSFLASITIIGEKYLLKSMNVFWVLIVITVVQVVMLVCMLPRLSL